MWEITEVDGRWVLSLNGEAQGDAFGTYDLAVATLATMMMGGMQPQASSDDGLLPERWYSPTGICFSAPTGPSRDFSNCAWSWRDPASTVLPLMLQTSTDIGHFGAQLAGFMDEVSMANAGTPTGSGRFFDNETGRAARDLLLDGRSFPVSVDPSENVTAEFRCTETDPEWGDCIAGVTEFTAYEIAGLTMTPMAGFGDPGSSATITLQTDADAEPPVVPNIAASGARTNPPTAWFTMPEPALGSDLLVEQRDGSFACPLTITDDGHVYGHLARWGQCHVADPWGPNVCVEPPASLHAYSNFHTGVVRTAEGDDISVGPLMVTSEHAPAELTLHDTQAWYAHSSMGWADVHVIDGDFGPWVCGSLRPNVDADDVRVLRALSLSGDWRERDGELELAGALAVNGPGYPIQRPQLVRAAGGTPITVPSPSMRVRTVNGQPTSLVAAGVVGRCPECVKRAAAARGEWDRDVMVTAIREMRATLAAIELRTRHLVPIAAEALRASVSG
jgi:hypothetical protein